jgi:hypothetical protein
MWCNRDVAPSFVRVGARGRFGRDEVGVPIDDFDDNGDP